MKKISGEKMCYGLSGLLLLGFAVNTAIDYSRYNSTLNSAPFSVWVLVNAICFVVPAAIVLAVGLVLRKKRSGKKG